MISKIKGHLAMVGANVMWGLMAPVVKQVLALGVVTPLLITDFRIGGAALLFWLTSLFLPREHVPPLDLLRLAGAACLGILFNQGCYIFGVSYTYPGEAAIITTTMPLWVMILAALLLHEPITAKKIGGVALGAAGAIILVTSRKGSAAVAASNPMLGDMLVLGAQLSYALYLTLYKNFIKRYSLVTLMKWMFTFAAVALLPVSLPTIMSTPWAEVTSSQVAGITFIVMCGTFLAYICIMAGQKVLRPTLVGMYNYVQPVVATSVGVWLGIDAFTLLKLLAVVMIFGGVLLVNRSRSKAE